jgi:large subunit ribosomal protein L21
MKQTQAIIQLQGKQFQVTVGDKLTVDRLETEVDTDLVVKDVLMVISDKTTTIGTPLIKDASVTFKVLDHDKGKKIRVFKFKSKSKYRRTYGHRQHQSQLEVTKISA